MPILRRSAYRPLVSSAATSWPSTRTAPDDGRSWPPIRRSILVLPEPEPPMTATTSPRAKSMSSPVSIGRLPKAKRRSRISTMLPAALGTGSVPVTGAAVDLVQALLVLAGQRQSLGVVGAVLDLLARQADVHRFGGPVDAVYPIIGDQHFFATRQPV